MNRSRLFQNLKFLIGKDPDRKLYPKSNCKPNRKGANYEFADGDGLHALDGLTDSQIAKVVTNVSKVANAAIDSEDNLKNEWDNPIRIDEFIYLTGDDTCDILGLVDRYKHSQGDDEMLDLIRADPLMHGQCQSDDSFMSRLILQKYGTTAEIAAAEVELKIETRTNPLVAEEAHEDPILPSDETPNTAPPLVPKRVTSADAEAKNALKNAWDKVRERSKSRDRERTREEPEKDQRSEETRRKNEAKAKVEKWPERDPPRSLSPLTMIILGR